MPIIFPDFQGELNILNEVLFAIILNVKTKEICDAQSGSSRALWIVTWCNFTVSYIATL